MTSLTVAAQLHMSVAMTSMALAAQLRGELGTALRIADDAIRLADRSPDRQRHSYPVLWARGMILIELDRLDEARSALQASMRHAEELGVQLHVPRVHVYLALERFTAGEWDDALAEAQAGLELAGEIGETYASVSGRIVRSLILLHHNDLPGAREAAEAELAVAGTLAAAALRQAGGRRGRRGSRGRPRSGWASLTPAERAVASLVADRLTNPQIGARLYISRRTVQTHLVHVFAKLDIASRAQLAAQVTRHRD
jgi:DNA-binding CsgD family transcriptional regulator